MSGERWLEFQPGEMKKVKAYLKDVYAVSVADSTVDASVWLAWHDSKLEIGYSFGSMFNRELADFVASELAKRFKVKKIGADSTGWYKDSDWKAKSEGAPARTYGSYTSWAAWIKDYKPEWSYIGQVGPLSERLMDKLRYLRMKNQAQFIELDQIRNQR